MASQQYIEALKKRYNYSSPANTVNRSPFKHVFELAEKRPDLFQIVDPIDEFGFTDSFMDDNKIWMKLHNGGYRFIEKDHDKYNQIYYRISDYLTKNLFSDPEEYFKNPKIKESFLLERNCEIDENLMRGRKDKIFQILEESSNRQGLQYFLENTMGGSGINSFAFPVISGAFETKNADFLRSAEDGEGVFTLTFPFKKELSKIEILFKKEKHPLLNCFELKAIFMDSNGEFSDFNCDFFNYNVSDLRFDFPLFLFDDNKYSRYNPKCFRYSSEVAPSNFVFIESSEEQRPVFCLKKNSIAYFYLPVLHSLMRRQRTKSTKVVGIHIFGYNGHSLPSVKRLDERANHIYSNDRKKFKEEYFADLFTGPFEAEETEEQRRDANEVFNRAEFRSTLNVNFRPQGIRGVIFPEINMSGLVRAGSVFTIPNASNENDFVFMAIEDLKVKIGSSFTAKDVAVVYPENSKLTALVIL